ncbi:MAG: response regulator [Planctomycetes bacterium]|nr:response regulator [Planctomycetota bacterium]
MNTPNSANRIENQADSPQAALELEGLQVLLAEDCPDQGRLFLKFLQLAGASVTLECTGQSAVDTVRKSTTPFDAVVMDFQMPELDGLDATRQLRELGHSGAIIAVTAFDSIELKQSWFQAGCNEFLRKPLQKAELVDAILRHTTSQPQC